MEKIPVSGPWITQKEIDYVADAAAKAWYANANLYNARFENAFAAYLGVKYAVSLPSCTAAIHLSLLAAGLGPGDEVIVPDVTWIGTSAPISYVGATTVFADIDPKTWCLAADSFEKCITSKTKAVIPVDLYGNIPNWNALLSIAKKNNITVIEDAAEAIGSEYKVNKAGTFGITGVFSFHGSKTMTTGEGGMLVTDNEKIYDKVLFLRDHGRKPGDVSFFNEAIAYKYRMSSLQAAFGLAQIERIEELIKKKRQIFGWYKDALSGIDGITLNYEAPETKNTYWMVTAILEPGLGIEKSRLMQLMAIKNIDCRPFFPPLSSIPAYSSHEEAKKARERNIVSYSISPYGINLPSGLNMDEEKVRYVSQGLQDIIHNSHPER